jgi:Cys-rich protein (TIGR01571 family)
LDWIGLDWIGLDWIALTEPLLNNMTKKYRSDDDDQSERQGEATTIPTIRVIAPATLREGYTFDVMVHDEPFTIEVPKGGVKEGQEFEVLYDYETNENQRYDDDDDDDEDEATKLQDADTMPVQTMSDDDDDDDQQEEKDANSLWYDEATGAPIGRWRSSLCSCCDVVTQSTFWMGLCCTPVLMAQLIARLGLAWNGRTGASPEEASLSYNRIVLSMMVVLGICVIPFLGGLAMVAFYAVIVVGVGAQVRSHVRQKYKIPPTIPCQCAHRFDDGCCMLLCGCCSAIQMARHTHDDKDFPGHGCTTTGLGLDAPKIV